MSVEENNAITFRSFIHSIQRIFLPAFLMNRSVLLRWFFLFAITDADIFWTDMDGRG